MVPAGAGKPWNGEIVPRCRCRQWARSFGRKRIRVGAGPQIDGGNLRPFG